jgi:tRNA A64-2'-O-ribosylphosphate transferase
MPDALSKTVPIWCAVINHALFPSEPDAHQIHVPPQVVSESELSQIKGRFKTYTDQFDALALDVSQHRKMITKPLRPIWVTPDSMLPDSPQEFPDFHPIVLCTASRRVQGAEISEFGYIQGAGDDSEAWAYNLTADAFWKHRDRLLITPEEELPSVIQSVMEVEQSSAREAAIRPITQTKDIILTQNADLAGLRLSSDDFVVFCAPKDDLAITLQTKHIRLECRSGKLGSRDLRLELYKLLSSTWIPPRGGKLYMSCPDGKDLCVGVALAVICLFVDERGDFIRSGERGVMTKTVIRQRLGWITISFPSATPSRATLQSVNGFLFSSAALQPQ